MTDWQVNGFKPKTRAQFDASEVLKKLQELLQQHVFSDRYLYSLHC